MIIYLIKQNIVVFVSFLRGKSLITSVWTRSMLLDFKKSTYSIRLKETEIKTPLNMYLQTVLRLNSEDSLHYDGRHGIMTHNLDYVLSSLFSGLKRCCERKLCLGDLALSPDGTGNDCVKCFTVLFFAWELTTGSHWSKSLCFSSSGSLMEIFLSDCV